MTSTNHTAASTRRVTNPPITIRYNDTHLTSTNHVSVLGDERTNQNPALLAFGILFFRWHNKVAMRVQEEHPDWSDEEVFQRARRIVVATLQVSSLWN